MNTRKLLSTTLISACAAISLGQTWQATKLQYEGQSIAYAHAYGTTTVGATLSKDGYVATVFENGKPTAFAPKMDGETAAFWLDKDGVAIFEILDDKHPAAGYWWKGKEVKRITVDKYETVDVVGASNNGHFAGMAYVRKDGAGIPYFYDGSGFKQITIAGVNNINAVAMNESETVVLEGNNRDGTRQLYAWKDGNATALPLIGKKIRGFAISDKGTVAGRDDKGNVVVIPTGEKAITVSIGAGYTVEVSTVLDDGRFVARMYDKKHEDGQLVTGDTSGYQFVSSLLKGKYNFNDGWFLPGANYIVAHNLDDDGWYRVEILNVKFDGLDLPAKLIGGANYSVKVRFSAPAPEDTTVKLDFDRSLGSAPEAVVVKRGRTEATFTFVPNKTDKKFQIKLVAASPFGSQTVSPWVFGYTTSVLDAAPNYFAEGGKTTMTLHLPVAAPEGGLKVKLEGDRPELARVPTSLFVPAGEMEASFEVSTLGVDANTKVLVSAWFGTTRVVGTFTVRPLRVNTFEGSAAAAKTGDKISFTVTIEAPAPNGGRVIQLSTLTADTLQLPATVKIPSGQTSVTFTAVVISKNRESVKVKASAPANNLYFKVNLN